MVLTPLDIHNKEFPVKMRGYDQDEVNDYLDQIIKDYEMVLKDKRELEKKLKFSEEKVEHFNNLQDALNKSIIVAQEAADRVRENANKESRMITLEAEKNADRLLDEAVTKARKITFETDTLKKESRVFKQRLQLLIESQLEMVKNNEWDELLQAPTIEAIEIPTLKDVLSGLPSSSTDDEVIEEEINKLSALTSFDDVTDVDDEKESFEIEGTLAAIELPEDKD
ncbi:DivIVA domain-containing protein [Carnobacterium gallinarum]|uniref:DivIVA domain-containing protein n=1 Tax=Carnobacterium gallinarum TaxID=2749 RepID=UPI0005536C68|nr:DivIVA domain-containing protein [Carnobacterium gallinarum]